MDMEKMLRHGRTFAEMMIGSAFILLVGLCLSLERNTVATSEFFTMGACYALLLVTGVWLKEVSNPMVQPHTQTH